MLALYGVLSLQGTADLLVWGLSRGYVSLQAADGARGAKLIVVLSNGVQARQTSDQELAVVNLQSSFNVLEGARLYRLLGEPRILVSGGPSGPTGIAPESQTLALALEQLGVSKADIALESRSPSTYSQVVNVATWVRANASGPFILVTSPEHVRRAVGIFRKQGLEPIASISNPQYGGSPFWLPSGRALLGSQSAIYEYLAWAFYRSQGWL